MTIKLKEETEFLNIELSEVFCFDTFTEFIVAFGEEKDDLTLREFLKSDFQQYDIND